MDTATMDPPRAAWLARRAAADPAEFAPIYDHYFPRVYNYIRYRVRGGDATDDLTARTFERALARIDSFRPERCPFGAWLFTIARNTVNDHLRHHRRWRLVSTDWLADRGSDARPADESLAGRERRDRLLAAVGRLRQREQDVLALKFAAGQTNREIARLTGLREGNVGVILHRTVRKLRRELEREE